MAPTVQKFYAGKCVLITGGTGFLGKMLIEKLLRSCSDLDTIYLLLRQKRGVTSEERLRELCNNKVFAPLKEKNPDVFKKLKLVCGDILEDELGISNDDREELQMRCNIIFHSAACVRFDQKLKDAVNLNTTGTYRVLKLAETMKHLDILVHISTAYCRCDLDVLEEKLYPAVHKPANIMNIVTWMDDDLLNHLEPKLISSEPNTYAYTKAITEDMVAGYASKFTTAIARPSIVTAAMKEPLPGWVDNLNGPTGLLIGSGKGVIRTMHCVPSYTADALPVDLVVNGLILVAYTTAIDKPKEAKIYNITLSGAIKNTWGDLIKLGEDWVNQYPYSLALWYPGGSIKSYRWMHQIHALFCHLIPAYLVDMLLFLLGMKPFLVKLHKRIEHGLDVLQYYTTKEWHFKNSNYRALRNRLSEAENAIFYTDASEMNLSDYLRQYVIGSRVYCCNDDLSNLPKARKIHKIRYILDIVTKTLFYGLILWLLYTYSHLFTSFVKSLDSTLKYLTPANRVHAEEFIENI